MTDAESWAVNRSGYIAAKAVDARTTVDDNDDNAGTVSIYGDKIEDEDWFLFFKPYGGETYVHAHGLCLYMINSKHLISDSSGRIYISYIKGSVEDFINRGYIGISEDGGKNWRKIEITPRNYAANVYTISCAPAFDSVYVTWAEAVDLYWDGEESTAAVIRVYTGKVDIDNLTITDVFEIDANTGAWKRGGNTVTHRDYTAGNGSNQNAIKVAGYTGSYYRDCEKFNGTSWASTGSLPTALCYNGVCGNGSGALSAGGRASSGFKSTCYKFNGSTWASTGSLSSARAAMGCAGTSSSAIVLCGDNGSSVTNAYQTYNGSTWSTSTGYPASRTLIGAVGTPAYSMGIGGATKVNPSTTSDFASAVYQWNGTTWSATTSYLVSASPYHAGGTADNCVVLVTAVGNAGYTYAPIQSVVWNNTVWRTSAYALGETFACAGGATSATNGIVADGMGLTNTTFLLTSGTAWYDISTTTTPTGEIAMVASDGGGNIVLVTINPVEKTYELNYATLDATPFLDHRCPSIDYGENGSCWILYQKNLHPFSTDPIKYNIVATSPTEGKQELVTETTAGSELGITNYSVIPSCVIIDKDGNVHTVFKDISFPYDIHPNIIYAKRNVSTGDWILERTIDYQDHVTHQPLSSGMYSRDHQIGQMQLIYTGSGDDPYVIVAYPDIDINNGIQQVVCQIRYCDNVWSDQIVIYGRENEWYEICHTLFGETKLSHDMLQSGFNQAGLLVAFSNELLTDDPAEYAYLLGNITVASVPWTVIGISTQGQCKVDEYYIKRRGNVNTTHVSTGGQNVGIS